ncbi:MAG: hypothetical protein ACREBD_02930 [Blastocatellia bacterium]
MIKPSRFRKALTVAVMLAVGGFYSLMTTSALAQAAKAAGELSVTGSVMINGTQAISGATVFSDSKVKTSRSSGATINLGKLGRVQLGPESEMALRFSEGNIGGNLMAGRAVVSAPAGISINVATIEGVATADGKQAATLTIDVTCGNTRVAASRSAAKVTSGSKVEYVAAGSEVAVGQAQAAPRCARLSTAGQSQGLSSGALAALIIAGVGGAVAGIVAASQADNVTPSSIVVSGFRP